MKAAAVLGAGSWGTALAVHLARAGHDVRLWARDNELAAGINRARENVSYLPGTPLPSNVTIPQELADALRAADLVVSAVPSHGLRNVMRMAQPHLTPHAPIVSATKGLEADTLCRMSEVIAEECGAAHAVVVLSGPSFASEVARQLPTAIVAASADASAIERVQHEFRTSYFRLYGTTDVVGVEIAGAMKNVIAIAAGVVEGLGLGQNALAALITRGLAEISRLVIAAGGRRETTAGLSGLGDLVLTCTGSLSRNRHVGLQLATGKTLPEIVASMKMVAEGIRTTSAAVALGRKYDVELPIVTQMAAVFDGRSSVPAAIEALMVRPQRAESA
ncbi:MAG TPA: NAD(P)H-dependent glycerol-3-phosphate dehydrogenase [Vicinamibacterales bacterium]|jgi:glycerol-3-phosphate dehydrogenase (NAD(P)+)|nr:NAD(P)H-dependent glycerol-3-phosphate dehydrogenase [Vicinamibacterales bacterium]